MWRRSSTYHEGLRIRERQWGTRADSNNSCSACRDAATHSRKALVGLYQRNVTSPVALVDGGLTDPNAPGKPQGSETPRGRLERSLTGGTPGSLDMGKPATLLSVCKHALQHHERPCLHGGVQRW